MTSHYDPTDKTLKGITLI